MHPKILGISLGVILPAVILTGQLSFADVQPFSSSTEISMSSSTQIPISPELDADIMPLDEELITKNSKLWDKRTPESILAYRNFQINPITIKDIAEKHEPISVVLDNQRYELILEPNPLFAPDAWVRVTLENGTDIDVPKTPIWTYKGYVSGLEESNLRITISPNYFGGFIQVKDETFFIEHNADQIANRYIIYKSSDTTPFEVTDDVIERDTNVGNRSTSNVLPTNGFNDIFIPSAMAQTTYNTKIILDCDQEFYNINQSNWTTRQINVLNDIEGIYSNIGVNFEVVGQSCDFTNTKLTSNIASTLVLQLSNRWDENPAQRHIVHLFSGKELSGVTIGGSFTPGIDKPLIFGYSLSQHVDDSSSNYDATDDQKKWLMAHEVGHNFGGTHEAQGLCTFFCTIHFDTI